MQFCNWFCNVFSGPLDLFWTTRRIRQSKSSPRGQNESQGMRTKMMITAARDWSWIHSPAPQPPLLSPLTVPERWSKIRLSLRATTIRNETCVHRIQKQYLWEKWQHLGTFARTDLHCVERRFVAIWLLSLRTLWRLWNCKAVWCMDFGIGFICKQEHGSCSWQWSNEITTETTDNRSVT
jgi:hypothetical protein